ncbi:hypothetical protein P153DRAFT_387176 [Dothidotthia symphoricarpi CBS 119687]|uniref:Lipocalin-like domain-containing protein n=1 Tax=Dothidotthia symphoricarpi CBS 119687 TaxID=1392245 RepID=A0A6A6ABY9_9PLEO|nr:uncharacterized protein P153DRAFT_387176 [Dothidotthia symphoricarpi CBS 119687]KAF2128221.1 hypothetical protein P153DRAFT_387176 [Dothidotthia symphoricarpi CBS 119687]
MHLPLILATASLAAALPNYATPVNTRSTASKRIVAALAGTYSLVNTSSTLNGISIPDEPYGAHPVGILTYSASGYVSATITATEPEYRPALTFPYQPDDTDHDWAQIGKHSIAYAGPFHINEALPASRTDGQLFHGPLVVANVPTWVGVEHKRNYTVVKEGSETYLRIGSERGGGYRGVLWWKRLD